MDFSSYLITKKIDEQAFRAAEPAEFAAWSQAFAEMHPNSFTMQKLNLINPVRRKYPLKTSPPTADAKPEGNASADAPKALKPVFKPKPKIN